MLVNKSLKSILNMKTNLLQLERGLKCERHDLLSTVSDRLKRTETRPLKYCITIKILKRNKTEKHSIFNQIVLIKLLLAKKSIFTVNK